MEESKMNSRTTTSCPDRRPATNTPEEDAILARFLSRVGGGAGKAVNSLSHGSFLVL
jgi:hypothetical protein